MKEEKNRDFSLNLKCNEGLFGEKLEVGFLNKSTGKFKTLFMIDKVSDSIILDRQVFVAKYKENIELQNMEDGLFMHIGHGDNFLEYIFKKSELSKDWKQYLFNNYNISKCNAFGSVENFEVSTHPTMEVNISLSSGDININKKETCYIYVDRENSTITVLLSVWYGDDEAVEKIVIRQKDGSSGNLFYINVGLGKFLNKEKYDIIQTDYLKSVVCSSSSK